jgi:hypothetical protein
MHPDVEKWSLRSFIRDGKCFIVDAIEPVTYCFDHGMFFKQWKGNPKRYPLMRDSVDEHYYRALQDLSRIKIA